MQLYGTWWCRRALLTYFYGSLYNSVVALFDIPEASALNAVYATLKADYIFLLIIILLSSLSVAQVNVPGVWVFFLLYSGGLQIICFKYSHRLGDGQNTDPQSKDYPNGLPKWTTLKWNTSKNTISDYIFTIHDLYGLQLPC